TRAGATDAGASDPAASEETTRMVKRWNDVRKDPGTREPRTNRRFQPALEVLEDRCLLSAPAGLDWLVAPPTQAAIATLDLAQTLNFSVNPGSAAHVLSAGTAGSIVNHDGAGAVDWYRFTLDEASSVQLTTFDNPGGKHLDSVLSLFN